MQLEFIFLSSAIGVFVYGALVTAVMAASSRSSWGVFLAFLLFAPAAFIFAVNLIQYYTYTEYMR